MDILKLLIAQLPVSDTVLTNDTTSSDPHYNLVN